MRVNELSPIIEKVADIVLGDQTLPGVAHARYTGGDTRTFIFGDLKTPEVRARYTIITHHSQEGKIIDQVLTLEAAKGTGQGTLMKLCIGIKPSLETDPETEKVERFLKAIDKIKTDNKVIKDLQNRSPINITHNGKRIFAERNNTYSTCEAAEMEHLILSATPVRLVRGDDRSYPRLAEYYQIDKSSLLPSVPYEDPSPLPPQATRED
jgi:hypothetical protein